MKFVGKISQARLGDVLITQYEVGECVISGIGGCAGCVFDSTECTRTRFWAECPGNTVFHPTTFTEELEHHRSLLALKGELL